MSTADSSFSYSRPRPDFVADWVVRTMIDGHEHVLLVERLNEPFIGWWALPAGHVEQTDPSVEDGAARELLEETGLAVSDARLVGTFYYRRNKTWAIAIAFTVLLDQDAAARAQAGTDARSLRWFRADSLPEIAFHHDQIIAEAMKVQVTGVTSESAPWASSIKADAS